MTVAGAEGRQVYWVCPLIDESDELRAQAAEDTAARLKAALPQVTVALVHGRMPAAAREQAMSAFKAGKIQLLVATTVIEVGVDVPNATLMVIENAERISPSRRGSNHRCCCSSVPNNDSSSILPVSGAEQLTDSGASHKARPVISASGAYCTLVSPAP